MTILTKVYRGTDPNVHFGEETINKQHTIHIIYKHTAEPTLMYKFG